MKQRQLGRSSLQVAPICLGGNVFGWTLDEASSFTVLDAAVEHGLRFIDTADVYSRWAPGHQGGESETILGKWMKERGNRAEIVLATKVGMDMGGGKVGLSKARIHQAADASLKRLQTDYIDLYQSHKDDEGTPLEETMSAFADLVQAGKVRVLGASNYSGKRLEEAEATSARLGLPRYESLQPNYNLYAREEFERELRPVCEKHGIGVISYYSLASGFLTGKYRSEADLGKSARGGGVKQYMNERGMRILGALDAVAKERNSKPAAVALSWLIAQLTIVSPIASATGVEQVKSLAEAAELQLSSEDLAQLDAASAY